MKHLLLVFGFAMACYTAKSQVGRLDPSFGKNGLVRTIFPSGSNAVGNVRDLFAGPGGTVYMVLAVGEFTCITRHLPDGALDLSYGDNGFSFLVRMSNPRAAMQADGKIVVVGTVFITNHDFIIARFNTNGTLDNSFAGDGIHTIDVGFNSDKGKDVAVQADGKIVVVGEANYDFTLIRFNPDGSLDNSFSGDGIAMADLFGFSDDATGIVIQNDGKLVVAGATTVANAGHMGVARFLPDGSLDNSFSDDGKTAILVGTFMSSVEAIALQSDGKIVLAGHTVDAVINPGNIDFAIVRLNTNGTPDNSFSGDGKQNTDFGLLEDRANAVVVQNDGKIVAAGFTNSNSAYAFALARYNTDGTPDNSFSGDGKVVTDIGPNSDIPYALALMADGKVVAGGAAFNTGYAAVRYNLDGTPDNSFDEDGIVIGGIPGGYTVYNSSVVQSDGKILAAGFTLVNANYHFAVARYNTDGSLDNSFSGDGKQVIAFLPDQDNFCFAMQLQDDGKIVLGGSGYNGGFFSDFALVRLNPDGSLDNSFSGDGKVLVDFRNSTEIVYSMGIQADGKIVVAGPTSLNNTLDFALARFNTDGTLDNSFSDDGKVITDFGSDEETPNGMVIQPDGKIIAVGVYDWLNPTANSAVAIARYNTNGELDTSFDFDGKVITNFSDGRDWAGPVALLQDGKIIIAGSLTTNNNDEFVLARYNSDGSLDNSFSGDGIVVFDGGFPIEGPSAIAIQTDGKIIVGGNVYSSSKYDFIMIRFNADGTADNSFSGDGIEVNDFGFGDDLIRSISISGNRVYAAGQSGAEIMYGVVAAYLIGETCTMAANIPDAMTLNSGVNTNTVYIGYTVASDLTLTVQVSGGTPPYSYSWSNGATTSSITVFPVVATTYTVTIRDANGCSTTASKLVNVVDVRCGNNKVVVCNVPPGNLSNASTTCIAANAVDEQLRKGSYLGNCTQQNLTTAKATEPYLQLVASPNPTSNAFTLYIRSKNYERAELIVWDVAGKLVERINVLPNTTVKIGAAYKRGVYMVEMRQGDERVSLKLIKN
jgi:uncharacterized delta-60 repeat protein